jgi:hypothetical protein
VILVLCQLCIFEFKEFIFSLRGHELVPVDREDKCEEFAGVSDHDHNIAVERQFQAEHLHVGDGQLLQRDQLPEGGRAETPDGQGSISRGRHIHV